MSMTRKHIFYVVILSNLTVCAVFVNYKSTNVNPTKISVGNDYVSVFSDIYKTKHWGKGSGDGSDPANAEQYITLLQKYFDDQRFASIVDLGCGDWQIMSHINVPENKSYKGFDVVPSIIDANNKQYTKSNIEFHKITSLEEFKAMNVSADLLVIKDVVQHWPNEDIQYFIKNILPNFKYALITNEYELNTELLNKDISVGQFRSLDLQSEPYNLQNVAEILDYHGRGRKQVLLYTNPNTLKDTVTS